MIDLKREIERELSLIDPPDLWERVQAEAADDGDADVLDLTAARRRRGTSWWLAVAAVTVLVALVAAFARLDDQQGVDTTPATVPTVSEPHADGPPTIIARANDVELTFSPSPEGELLLGQTLNIDAVEQDGAVTGEIRVNDLVVTLECAATRPKFGEIRLGGVVTEDPDGQGLPVGPRPPGVIGGDVGVGDRLAVVIRELDPDGDTSDDRVAFYADDSTSSCTELLAAVRDYLDGGETATIRKGDDIETGEGPFGP